MGDPTVVAGFVAVEFSLEGAGDVGTKLSGDCRARPDQQGAEHPPSDERWTRTTGAR